MQCILKPYDVLASTKHTELVIVEIGLKGSRNGKMERQSLESNLYWWRHIVAGSGETQPYCYLPQCRYQHETWSVVRRPPVPFHIGDYSTM